MKKLVLILMIIAIMTTLSGCIIYGKGVTKGYIYAVDDGIIWGHVWFKTSLDSSESDCYLISDTTLKNQLREMNFTERVEIEYKRHLFTLSLCGSDTPNDVINSVKVIE